MAEKQAVSALRLSPHYYNTLEEVDAAIEALEDIIRADR
jgi:selenocysteine lyase/cysteine desulfurase